MSGRGGRGGSFKSRGGQGRMMAPPPKTSYEPPPLYPPFEIPKPNMENLSEELLTLSRKIRHRQRQSYFMVRNYRKMVEDARKMALTHGSETGGVRVKPEAFISDFPVLLVQRLFPKELMKNSLKSKKIAKQKIKSQKYLDALSAEENKGEEGEKDEENTENERVIDDEELIQPQEIDEGDYGNLMQNDDDDLDYENDDNLGPGDGGGDEGGIF